VDFSEQLTTLTIKRVAVANRAAGGNFIQGALGNMGNEWPQKFIEELEEEISLRASRFNISQEQKIELECALERVFGRTFLLGYGTQER
jgi:hypothetical protein